MSTDGPDQYTPEQRAALEGHTPHTPTQLNRPDAQYGPTQAGLPPEPRVQPGEQQDRAAAVTQPAGTRRAPPPPGNPWRWLPAAAIAVIALMAAGGWIGVNYYAPVQHTVSDVFRNNAATKTQVAAVVIPARQQAPFAARVVAPVRIIATVTATATATTRTTATATARTTATDRTTAPGTTTTATSNVTTTATAPPVTSTVTGPGSTTTVTQPGTTTTVTAPASPPVTVTAPFAGPTPTVTVTVTLPPTSS